MGTDSFLGQVLAEGATRGPVLLRQSLRSAKDYIALADLLPALLGIAERGAAGLYNVASGVNTSHDAIVGVLTERLRWRIEVAANASAWREPFSAIRTWWFSTSPTPASITSASACCSRPSSG